MVHKYLFNIPWWARFAVDLTLFSSPLITIIYFYPRGPATFVEGFRRNARRKEFANVQLKDEAEQILSQEEATQYLKDLGFKEYNK